MRIGGTSRDHLMTLLPLCVAVVVAFVLLGGPRNALRMMEATAWDCWTVVSLWFR
jgi:hypothetical protein